MSSDSVKLFVGGMPLHYDEADMRDLFEPFGEIVEIVILTPKGSNGTSRPGFVKFRDPSAAEEAISRLNDYPIEGHTDRLIVRHSRPKQGGSSQSTGPSYPPRRDVAATGRSVTREGRPPGGSVRKIPLAQSRMLYFTIRDDPDNRIDVKVIDRVLCKCGQPVKILILDKVRDVQQGWALMRTHQQALQCIDEFDNRLIFRDSCLLRLELSDREDIEVLYNNEKSWDYFHDLPKGPPVGGGARPAILADDEFTSRPRADYPPPPPPPPAAASAASAPYSSSHRGRLESCVVLVNGLHTNIDPLTGEKCFKLDNLQKIFGIYGDVMRIKILPKKEGKDGQALVQYRRHEEAENARQKLDHCPVFDTVLSVFISEKNEIFIPHDPQNDPNFADFSDMRIGRYGPKFPVDKLMRSRGPSNVLFISGLPESFTNEMLKEIYEPYRPVAADVFLKHPGQGRVEFDRIADAMQALVYTHDQTRIGGIDMGGPIRVAFSDRGITTDEVKAVVERQRIR